MRVSLASASHQLELCSDEADECHLDLVGPDGRRRLGRDPLRRVKSRLLAGLQRALSDEFTVVGTIEGVPVVHLLSFEEASAVLYITMDTKKVIIQESEDGLVIGRLDVDRDVLGGWVGQLQLISD